MVKAMKIYTSSAWNETLTEYMFDNFMYATALTYFECLRDSGTLNRIGWDTNISTCICFHKSSAYHADDYMLNNGRYSRLPSGISDVRLLLFRRPEFKEIDFIYYNTKTHEYNEVRFLSGNTVMTRKNDIMEIGEF